MDVGGSDSMVISDYSPNWPVDSIESGINDIETPLLRCCRKLMNSDEFRQWGEVENVVHKYLQVAQLFASEAKPWTEEYIGQVASQHRECQIIDLRIRGRAGWGEICKRWQKWVRILRSEHRTDWVCTQIDESKKMTWRAESITSISSSGSVHTGSIAGIIKMHLPGKWNCRRKRCRPLHPMDTRIWVVNVVLQRNRSRWLLCPWHL